MSAVTTTAGKILADGKTYLRGTFTVPETPLNSCTTRTAASG